MVSSDFCTLNYHFVCVCVFSQLSVDFLIFFFFKKGCKHCSFLEFLCFKSNFLCLLKHYKNKGFSIYVFFVVEREEKMQTKMITGISGFVFCPKMAVS